MIAEAERDRLVRTTETWFVEHGLPWFVDARRDRARAALGRARLTSVGAVALVLLVGLALLVGRAAGDGWLGIATGTSCALLGLVGYAFVTLGGSSVVRWAGRKTLGSLGLMVPLAARALPLLLLFMTFLFINTEVWQVASRLGGGVMWAATMFFAGIGLLFLVTRLPEELDVFDEQLTGDQIVGGCARTPLADVVSEVGIEAEHIERHADVGGLERANLVLVLLVAQAVQVLLLSVAVWGFFMAFGAVAIDDAVITSWVGDAPRYHFQHVFSRELVRVSTFLAAFSGLYFTVYAVTDETYRRQFFTEVTGELERAVSVRVVYRRLREG
ncbi:MAG: hypothetical protein U0R78_14020 [Nocardioidaceae bacterium]